jgi:uncharacterized membrane protein
MWLGFIASGFYKAHFGMLGCAVFTGMQSKWPAAVVTYCLLALGFVLFVYPRLNEGPSLSNVMYGALFGLVLFGVYEGTNYLMFRDWPLKLVIVDALWGMFSYALTSCVVMGILRALKAYDLIK